MDSRIPYSESFRVWVRDVVEIKELFNDRKFKRCIARCEELQLTAVHPVHKTFLNFYQALSYESLGILAHRYSTTKLPLLNHAKDCFELAMQNLPQPFTDDADQQSELSSPPFKSPACVTLDVVKRYQYPSPVTESTTISPSDSTFSAAYHEHPDNASKGLLHRRRGSSVSSTYSNERPPSPCTTDKNDNPWALVQTPSVPRKSSKKLLSTPIFTQIPNPFHSIPSNHKARLSLSLSSNHFLVDNLVPSPLFRRISNPPPRTKPLVIYNPVRLQHDDDSSVSGRVCRGRLGSETTQDDEDDKLTTMSEGRPLPALPFNHKPHFEKRGSRHILIPKSSFGQPRSTIHPRASAIQTMVAKFEGKIQDSLATSFPVMPVTPITPRFKMIQDAFTVKKRENDNKNNANISTQGDSEEFDDDLRAADAEKIPSPETPARRTVPDALPTPTPLPTILYDQHQLNAFQDTPQNPLTQSFYDTPLTNSTSTSTSTHDSSYCNSNLNFNLQLTSFRTSLDYHLTSINSRIESATKIQEDHRARSIRRSMSFWSFDVNGPTSKEGKGKEKERVRQRYSRGQVANRGMREFNV